MFFLLGCSCFSIFKGFFQNSKGFNFNFKGRCSWQAFVLCSVLFIFSWGCRKQLFFTLLGKFLLNVFLVGLFMFFNFQRVLSKFKGFQIQFQWEVFLASFCSVFGSVHF